jgi:hypothetical protein
VVWNAQEGTAPDGARRPFQEGARQADRDDLLRRGMSLRLRGHHASIEGNATPADLPPGHDLAAA